MLEKIERQKILIETSKEKERVKEVLKKKNNTLEESTLEESLRRKLDAKEKERLESREIVNKGGKNNNNDSLKEKANSDSVVKVKVEVVNKEGKKCNSLKEKIDERLKSIERDIIYTQTNSLTKLTKNMKILNTPLEIDRKRDIAVLNTTELLDNEKTDRHVSNTICYKCKKYGHTKKQCDRHNKNIKLISK